jgi:hypothetical protein
MTSGDIITGSNEVSVTNTSTTAISGYSATSFINGNLRRSISSSGAYDFPVGSIIAYELMTVTLSSTSGFSNLLCNFVVGDPAPGGLANGLLKNGKYYDKMLNHGYWSLEPNSTMSSGTYGVTLYGTGFTNSASSLSKDPESFTVLKRHSSSNNWDINGNTDNSKQEYATNKITCSSIGLTTFSHFGQGTGGSTLPIKLISFDAKLKGNTVDLNWETGAEINNDYFTIERSSDGINFKEIIREKGAGNSTQALYYHGNDDSPESGYNYYRLKQTDYDGHYTYSNIKTIKIRRSPSIDGDLKIESVFPNPFQESINVKYTLKNSTPVTIALINSSGQIIKQDRVNSNEGLNTYEYFSDGNLTKGVYFISLVYDDQKVIQKIIKE